MSEILFLAHRLPFPPDRGDKIRSHHILKGLADIAPVHVATFVDTHDDWAHESELALVAATYCLRMRDKSLLRAGIEALWRREPVSLAAFRDAQIATYVKRTLRERPISAIYVFSGQMGQYVPAGFSGRVVMDLVDVDSAKFEAYAQTKPWPRSFVDTREGRLLKVEEERLARRSQTTLLVSEAEAALFRSRISDPGGIDIRALGNGIDADFFDPGETASEPSMADAPGPHLVFTGQMDYAPNIEAAQRVAGKILPAIRQHYPSATFHVVGRAPVRELVALDGENGVKVWGGVPDIRPFLAGADVVAAPLAIARGVQNKVLEAMAMARPVVLTPEAATGIDADDGVNFAIGKDDAGLIAQTLSLLGDGQTSRAIGTAARRFVIDRQGWPAMLAPLPRIMGFGTRQGARAEVRRDAA